MSPVPRVSIGLPVLNGEKYLPDTLACILAQSFSDFELIISDNASTDATEAICRDYASRDSRIRYYRNYENVGAARNFNLVFGHSRGEYFKWAAHDDQIAPTFLSRCVEALDQDNYAVLAYSKAKIIDANGEIVGDYKVSLPNIDSASPHRRFADLVLINHLCVKIFGVIRADILRRTPLIGSYIASDRVLLAELGLYGRFCQIPEYLFSMRDHAERSLRAMPFHFRAAWFDPANRGRLIFPHMKFFREYFRCVSRVPLSTPARALCSLQLLRWPWVNMNWARMIADVVAVAAPGTVPTMVRLGERLVTTKE